MEEPCKMGRKRGLAIEPMEYMEDTKICPKCGPSSKHDCKYKFLNNKSSKQPRYQCLKCKKFFTHYPASVERSRPFGKTYPKARHVDPPAVQARLKHLELKCPHCGAIKNARFMYNNNKSTDQPRFKCLACGKQFQGTEDWKLKEPQGTQILERQNYYENYPHSIHNIEEGWKTNDFQSVHNMGDNSNCYSIQGGPNWAHWACNNPQLQGGPHWAEASNNSQPQGGPHWAEASNNNQFHGIGNMEEGWKSNDFQSAHEMANIPKDNEEYTPAISFMSFLVNEISDLDEMLDSTKFTTLDFLSDTDEDVSTKVEQPTSGPMSISGRSQILRS